MGNPSWKLIRASDEPYISYTFLCIPTENFSVIPIVFSTDFGVINWRIRYNKMFDFDIIVYVFFQTFRQSGFSRFI